LVERLLDAFGERVAGLKDSSGDLAYSRAVAALRPLDRFGVFPSNEAALMDARSGGPFAGCISATANLNADLCARAYREGDAEALAKAVAIRRLFDGRALVAGVKALLAHIHRDSDLARTLPPLSPLSADDVRAVVAGFEHHR
jgi:4-hydroxy-tetrahydrodipicolinate synthase